MNSIATLYIDASEEITAVIERLKGAHEGIVALVVPKGAALTQSIVNLKLIRRAAQDAAKDVILVTTDKIGRNLATQVGIPVASNEKEVPKVASGSANDSDEENNVIAGVRIHRYYAEEESEEAAESEPEAAPAVIVPKELLQPDPIKETPAKPAETKELIERPEIAVPAIAEEAEVPAVVETPPTATPTPEPEPVKSAQVAPAESPRIQRKNIDAVPETIVAAAMTAKQGAASPKKNRRALAMVMGLVLILIALGAISFLFLPKTDVILTVNAQPLSQDVSLTAKQNSNNTDGALAAETTKEEGSSTVTFNATGTKKVGEAAKGTATFYNYGSTSSQTVPAGTTITASGKSFTTNEAVVVPGYTQAGIGKPLVPGKASVATTATEPGSDGNMTDAAITGSIANNANLSGTITASGGSSQDVQVVTATDIANAKNAVIKQLQEELSKKVSDQLNGREITYAEGSDIFTTNDFSTTVASGAEAANGQATIKGSFERTFVDSDLIKQAAADLVKQTETASDKRVVDTTDITTKTFNKDDKSLTLAVHVTGKITPVFSTELLPDNLRGHTIEAAESFVKGTTPTSSVEIDQKPTWWPLKRLPTFAKYITVQIKYE